MRGYFAGFASKIPPQILLTRQMGSEYNWSMIISVSRRTDIPAFYTDWFIHRIRAGYCTVPNPFNPKQVTYVDLQPDVVDVIVFWTRNPRPLFPFLSELEDRGYLFCFQYTLLNNPRVIDVNCPPLESAISTFHELAEQIGPQRVIWRYDPLVLSEITSPAFHRQSFAHIAQALRGYTHRSVISLLDVYPKLKKRLGEMEQRGAKLIPFAGSEEWFSELMIDLAASAATNDMLIFSCAEKLDLVPYGIRPGKCIDDEYIQNVFGLEITSEKDPGQRKACGCVRSKDIGMYESCLFGCQYCYATSKFERARANYNRHDKKSPSLLGRFAGDL